MNFARSQVESVMVMDETLEGDASNPDNVIRMNSWENGAVEV